MPDQSKFQWLIRLGFVARGLLYMTIGFLVLKAGRTEDHEGALAWLGNGVGKWLLVFLAGGFAAYGLWRLADAIFGMESGREGKEALGMRLAAGFSGIVHLFLAIQSFFLLQTARGAPRDAAEQRAEGVLQLPGGPFLLGLVAIAFLVAGLYQLVDSARCGFLRRLGEGAGRQAWVRWLGRLGYAARGLLFLVCGWFLARSAVESNPSEARGFDRALAWLSEPVDDVVAGGLFLFGLYSLVEARFRRVPEPPLEDIGAEMREKLAR